MRFRHFAAVALSLASFGAIQAADITASRQTAASKQARAGEAEFRELYKELVEINTTLSVGSCTDAANAMKARLRPRATRTSNCMSSCRPAGRRTAI